MPRSIVISDTSSLIVLTKIGQLDLLNKLYSQIITTPEIVFEFGNPLPDWIQVIEVKNRDLKKSLELQLDLGEASAIALAHEIPDSTLILDDLKGRKIAKLLKLKFTGTLGILGRAKSEGFIPLLKPILDKLLETNFRVSNQLIEELLKTYDEI
jgi:predicted nucleic acid-binding protein